MKYLFYVVGGVLVLSGILHLVEVFTTPFDTAALLPTVFTAAFGLAYLVIGGMLALGRESALKAGIAVPLIGAVLTLMSMNSVSTPNAMLYLALDVAAIVLCIFLLRAGRPVISRVNK